MSTLQQLIGEARALAGEDLCAALGHDWKSFGGRACECTGRAGRWQGQAAYECTRCPAIDYGERGGPGWKDCEATCRHQCPHGVPYFIACCLDCRDEESIS